MTDKVIAVQDYLSARGIEVAETSIIDAAIKIAARFGGYGVFVCEFSEREKKQ